jgi:hypothetical protein
MDAVNHESGDDDGDAVRAFEALREEVAALRRGVELVCRQGQQAVPDAPDYSPTLGAMATTLTAVGSRLDAMEAHPALRLTPDLHAREIAAGVRAARNEASNSASAGVMRLQEAARELGEMIGAVRTGIDQRRRVIIALALGAALGFLAWWPLVAVLPWGGGDWLAATLIGGDRWLAGQTLMREADPKTWDRMVQLYNACPHAITADQCQAAMAAAASPAAPPVPPPEAVKPAPAAPVRPGVRSR